MREIGVEVAPAAVRQDALAFPFAEPPGPREIREVAPGILWARIPLPFRLDHVNIYLIEDDGGWAVADTGIAHDDTRAAWEALLSVPLQSFVSLRAGLLLDGIQAAIASNCSLSDGAGLKANRPCRFRIM